MYDVESIAFVDRMTGSEEANCMIEHHTVYAARYIDAMQGIGTDVKVQRREGCSFLAASSIVSLNC
jgi:hypothetical protein